MDRASAAPDDASSVHPASAGVGPAAAPNGAPIRLIFGLSLLLIAASTVLVYQALRSQLRARTWVAYEREVKEQIERTVSQVKDAETGQRGFLLTHDQRYLAPYESARALLPRELDRLAQLTRDDPVQRSNVAGLRELTQQKLQELEQTGLLARRGEFEAALALVRADVGRELMERIGGLAAAMRTEELRRLALRTEVEDRAQARGIGGVVGLGVLALALLWLVRSVSERERARSFASEQRLAVTFASIGDGVIATDARGHIERMNAVAESLTGWPVGEAVGRPLEQVFRIVHERTRAPAESPVDKVLRAGRVVGLANHTALLARDGGEHVIEDSAAPIRDERGAVSGVVLVFQDSTARHLAQRERNQLTQLIEQSGDYIALADAGGKLMYLNPAARALTGLEHDRYQGELLEEQLTPASRAQYRDTLLPQLESLGVASGRLELRRGAGLAPVLVDWKAFQLRDPDEGPVTGIAAIGRDLSDQQRLEAALRDSEEQFRALADNIPTLCWMADASGWIFWYNARWYQYTGMTPEQMQGWGWKSVHRPEVLPRVLERWQASLRSGEPFEMVFPLRAADGSFRDFLTRVAPVRDGAGRIVRWFGINTDISEQQANQAALREADRRKDEFLATLAHELRNPLAPIRNAASVIVSHGGDAAAHERAAQIIDRQVHGMARLLDDLLDMSRITRGRLTLQIQHVTLQSVLDAALEIAAPAIDARRHHLRTELPETPVSLDADPLRLAQVVSNLLTNAAKYTEPGGEIVLAARSEAGSAIISVRDNGIGLEPEALTHTFGMFTQVKSALKRSEGGLGIGLSLVKALVELHGGTVTARSAGLGHGSEFEVRVPLTVGPTHAASAGAAAGPASARRRRIVVADDNQDAAASLGLLLELEGHEVHLAYDGAAALEAIRALQPEIAIIDIGMPQLNGYEVARAVRAAGDGAAVVRLVALTGWGQEEDRRRAIAAGFDLHLTKPIDHEQLNRLLGADAAG